MTEMNIEAVFQAAAAKEAEAYALFEQRFEREFPAPQQAAVRMMQAIGWQFILIVAQSIFAIVLAALRTADMFFQAASSTNVGIQWGTAIAAVGAVEFGIVVFATIKSEVENRKSEIEDLKSALKVDVKLLKIGIGVGVVVSIIAGLGVSFQGFGIEWDGFKWALSITMGAGASIIAWVSGDILGAMLARWNNARTLANLEYSADLTARFEKKRDMWEGAPERRIARSELTELKEYLAASAFKAPPRTPRLVPERGNGNGRGGTSRGIREKIYAYLDAHATATTVPGPTELVTELGVSKGYASETIKDWIADRQHPVPAPETANVPAAD